MHHPLVTVILSSYNRPVLLRDAVDSVLSQSWPNIQLLVADDHSTDPAVKGYLRAVEALGALTVVLPDPPDRPRHPYQPRTERTLTHGGRMAAAINAALPSARGDFVAFLPDDDMMTPCSVEARATHLADNPDHFIVYGRLEACKPDGPIVPGFHSLGAAPWDGTSAVCPPGRTCVHDRSGYWQPGPVSRGANRLDHSMFLVRRVGPASVLEDGRTYGPRKKLPTWPTDKVTIGDTGEVCLCPDAGFLYRLEQAGFGPFYSVPHVVVVKRYHKLGHGVPSVVREEIAR